MKYENVEADRLGDRDGRGSHTADWSHRHMTDGLMGATWFGYPLVWLVEMVVGPRYNPWVVRPVRLIVDIAAWTMLAWVILFLLARFKKKP